MKKLVCSLLSGLFILCATININAQDLAEYSWRLNFPNQVDIGTKNIKVNPKATNDNKDVYVLESEDSKAIREDSWKATLDLYLMKLKELF